MSRLSFTTSGSASPGCRDHLLDGVLVDGLARAGDFLGGFLAALPDFFLGILVGVVERILGARGQFLQRLLAALDGPIQLVGRDAGDGTDLVDLGFEIGDNLSLFFGGPRSGYSCSSAACG